MRETEFIAGFIEVMQPESEVILYEGVIYVNGEPLS